MQTLSQVSLPRIWASWRADLPVVTDDELTDVVIRDSETIYHPVSFVVSNDCAY